MLSLLFFLNMFAISFISSQYVNVTYVQLGCYYASSGNGVSCDISFYGIGWMTNQFCAQYCANRGYNLSATYFIYSCCCFNTFDASFQAINSTSCSSPCGGNSSEYCGSDIHYNTLSIYSTNQSQQIQCGMYLTTSTYGYKLSPMQSASTSVSLCLNWCYSMPANYSVLFDRCFCSNTTLNEYLYQSVNLTNCGRTCPANSSQYCGGSQTFIYTLSNITSFSISNTSYYAEYQGTYVFAASSFYGNPNDFSSHSISRYLKICLFKNSSFDYGAVISAYIYCFTNLTQLTRLASNTTSPSRLWGDYSYFNITDNGFFEIYRLRTVPDNYTPSFDLSYLYLGCYSNSIADAVYDMPYTTNLECIQFCAYLNYSYAATRFPRCYCGYKMRGISVTSTLCELSCSDNVENCGGSAGYLSLYQISAFQVLISCTTNQASPNTTVDCQITVTAFSQVNMTLELWNGTSLEWINLNSTCQTCNLSFPFSVFLSDYGSYALNATGHDSTDYHSTFVYIINVIDSETGKSQGGSYFTKYQDMDMYFISNNIIETSFNKNILKCASMCSICLSCTSFVYKTDQNCTLYATTSQNTNLFVQSPSSCLYLKKY